MTIAAAYDISFLAQSFNQPQYQSGVYRSVEQLLYAIARQPDVALTAVNVCGEDPLFSAINSLSYLHERREQLSCEFEASFKSGLRLDKLYLQAFGPARSADLTPRFLGSIRKGYSRFLRSLLYRLYHTHGIDRTSRVFNIPRYDVFHSPFLPLPSRELIGDVPRILTVYDLIFIHNPEFMTPDICALLNSVLDSIDIRRDWIACISEFTKQEFCEHTGMSPERVSVTPLAAPDSFRHIENADEIAKARHRYGIPEGDYFLALAALQPRKNFDHLIRCFFKLVSEYPTLPVNLVLAGTPSWLYEEIFTAADSSRALRSRVIFTGYIPDEDLSAVYSGAAAFVFPSLYEGFGLPPLEAMQCGTSVIASDVTALPEVIGDAGLLVDPRSCDELCHAMLTLLKNEKMRQELSQKGLERAKEFTWKRCAESTVDLYRKALNSC